MRFRSQFAIVFACASLFTTSAHANPFPLVAGNCDRELPGLLSLSQGDHAELKSAIMDGHLILDLKRTWADGKVESYQLVTSRAGLREYMVDQIKSVTDGALKKPVMMPVSDGGILVFPDRLENLRTGVDFIDGKKLERSPGLPLLFKPTYFSRDPMKSSELPEVLAEVMNDACAYETKLAADTRKMKEVVARFGVLVEAGKAWGKKAWSNVAPDAKVANQVQRKVAEKPAAIRRPKDEVTPAESHVAGAFPRE